jgi:FAD/FMN-containing dehydrogenase
MITSAAELAAQVDPDRLLTSGPRYDEARAIWNGAVDQRPAVIVRAETPAEVQAAVQIARRYHLPVSVRGGGHDWAGRAIRPDGLVIDLTGMRQVTVDPAGRVAIAAGGATARDVVTASAPYGLAAATGTVGAVGMAGLTLAGGYGPLNGRFGLALDNLLGAELVLADGTLLTTDATNEPELYWAIRGGGGNFGVVTAMTIRLHPVHQVLAGFIFYPWPQAADVWSRLDALLAAGPDGLTVQSGVLPAPNGGPALLVSPCWSGDPAEGEKVIADVQELGTPVMSQVAAMTYADVLSLFDAYVVNGDHYAIRTRSVAAFTADVIAALVEAGTTRTSPMSVMSIHHCHGAAARVPLDSTAFGIRRDHFVVEIVAAWHPDDDQDARHRSWTESVSTALAPYALPGGYPGLLGPDARDQIANAYGGNTGRLRAAKARYDPDGIFTATALP